MDLNTYMHHDHENLRSLAEDILKSTDDATGGLRDDQFELYDTQLRRHLDVVEELTGPLGSGDADLSDMTAEHKAIRAELKTLDRSPKNTREWSDDFARLASRFNSLAARHETFVSRLSTLGTPEELGRRYEEAKLRRMKGPLSRAATPTTLATVAGAAAIAGAAYAATRYFQGRRQDGPQGEAPARSFLSRRSGKSADRDFALKLDTDENLRLIASDKVEGTKVVDRDGSAIGTIKNLMIDKYTGRVAYAVLGFGGTFGFGESLFPLPWAVLTFDEGANGYRLNVSKEELQDAPRFEANDAPEFSPEYRRTLLVFYRRSGGSYDGRSSPDSYNALTSRSAFGFGSQGASSRTTSDVASS